MVSWPLERLGVGRRDGRFNNPSKIDDCQGKRDLDFFFLKKKLAYYLNANNAMPKYRHENLKINGI